MPKIALEAEILPPGYNPSTPTDVSGWKVKIASSWKAAAEGILQVAKDLYDAREMLKSQDRRLWLELAKQLDQENIISEGIQKKLLVIGDRYDALIGVAAYLPPRYNAIYSLKDFSDDQLHKLVKSKKLIPTLEDKEIASLRVHNKPIEEEGDTPAPAFRQSLLRIYQTGKRPTKVNKAALAKAVGTIRELSGFEVVLSPEGQKLLGEDEE